MVHCHLNHQELKKSSVYYLNVICHSGESDYLIRPAFVGSVSTECSIYPRAIMKAGAFTKHFSPIAVVLHKRFIRRKHTIWLTRSEEGFVKWWWVGEQNIFWDGLLWIFQGNRQEICVTLSLSAPSQAYQWATACTLPNAGQHFFCLSVSG